MVFFLWSLLRGYSAAIRGAAYSPEGTFVATVSEDKTLIMCNLQRVVNLDLLGYGCDRLGNYLQTNGSVEESDRISN